MIARLTLLCPAALAASFLLAACEPAPSAEEKAAADAREIAMVEAAQDRKPPIQPVSPQPITSDDIEKLSLFGTSCAFEPEEGRDPVLLAFDDKAVMMVGGQPVILASDSGGPGGPVGTWQHYVGKGLSLQVLKGAGDGVQTGYETLKWSGSLTVRDEFDRIVYTRSGDLICGS